MDTVQTVHLYFPFSKGNVWYLHNNMDSNIRIGRRSAAYTPLYKKKKKNTYSPRHDCML